MKNLTVVERLLILAFAAYLLTAAVGNMIRTEDLPGRCKAALSGASPLDSVRVYVVQPGCYP